MKRRIAVLFLTLLLLPSCNSTPVQVPPTTPVTLQIWANKSYVGGYAAVAEQFNSQFADKGIQIVFQHYNASEMAENLKLETNLMSGSGDIDLYFSYTTQALAKRIASGCALELTDLCARDGWSLPEMFSPQITKLYHDGKPYSVPATVGKMGIILNKDMFDAAGIPIPQEWTFEQFREIAAQLTHQEGENKVYGVYWNTNINLSEGLLHLTLPTLGGDPLYRNGGTESNFDNPTIYRALELLYNTMNLDGSAPNHEESVTKKLTMERMFFGQRCAMTVGAWLYNEAIDPQGYPHEFVTAFAPWPVVEEGSRHYTQGSLGYNLSINPKSAHIDQAWEFIKWYTTEGVKLNLSEGLTPSYTGIPAQEVAEELLKHSDGLVDGESVVRLFLNPDNNLSIPVISTRIDEVTACFDVGVEAALTQRKPLEQALLEAKAQADAILAAP